VKLRPRIPEISADALTFHNSCLLMDLHIDSLLIAKLTRINLCHRHSYWLPKGYLCFHADVPRLRLGNVTGAFLGLVPKPFGRNARHIESMINYAEKIAQQLPTLCCMARSAEDVHDAQKQKKVAFLLGLEGATGLDGDPRRIKYFAQRGVRYMGFVHFNENFVASPGLGMSLRAGKPEKGLSPYGKFLVDECIRNGVILDLAHISRQGFFDVIDLLPQGIPAIVSHAGICKANQHPRNLNDDQVRAIGALGGVVGVMNSSIFLGGHDMQTYIDHLTVARDLAGYKHVGIGSDFDGFIFPMRGLEDVSCYPSLTAALLDAGYPRHEIIAILGENMLRVLKAVPPKYPLQKL